VVDRHVITKYNTFIIVTQNIVVHSHKT